jgi:fused signal recognition particle receptor
MFNKLRAKIKSWTKKVSSEAEKVQGEIKEIPIPTKFEVGTQKIEPDIEKIKEIEKDLEKSRAEPEKEEKGFFQKITSKISKVKITEKEFDVYSEELEMLLLENNVALEVAEKIIKRLKEKIIGKELLKKEIEREITDSFKEIIEEILVEPFSITEKIKEKKEKPYVILFCGINGTGKTTTIAKLATYLKKEKISCVLAAADTFRAASIEQIKKHSEKIGLKTIAHNYGADPAAVGFDAIKYARKNKIDCVLIDTAGRMHTDKNLIHQIEKINRVCKPDLKIFVGESITGNDIIEQVKSFDWAINLDGIILTKADIDEKGGTALSVGYITKKPILYLGTGQEYNAIEIFDKKKFIEKLGL